LIVRGYRECERRVRREEDRGIVVVRSLSLVVVEGTAVEWEIENVSQHVAVLVTDTLESVRGSPARERHGTVRGLEGRIVLGGTTAI
jgi:hypothetical protein